MKQTAPLFERYLGIDYSGAETPASSLTGIRIYEAIPTQSPIEIHPPTSSRKYWTRSGLAQWLAAELKAGPATLVGIDHAFSFPMRYFEKHRLPPDWPSFLDDFHLHWPTDEKTMYVDFIRDGLYGKGAERGGSAKWRRLAEERCGAKSVFHFDVPGSVAKSTHAGLPWLRFLRRELGTQLHFWPFDGWQPPQSCSVIAEVYPALWSRSFSNEGRNDHQHDAYSVARWMQEKDSTGEMSIHFQPNIRPAERTVADTEGWILGLG